jgi:excisionase family DNA binding protein
MNEIRKMLNDNAVLPLWPDTGKILGLSRGGVYRLAEAGDIRTIRLGRLKRVPTAWLRQKLGWDEPAA